MTKGKAEGKAETKKMLSIGEFIILSLIDKEINYGLDIVDKSNGLVNRGTVYNTLQRFEEAGFLSCRKKVAKTITVAGSNVPKTQFVATYRLTQKGKRILKDNLDWFKLMWKTLSELDAGKQEADSKSDIARL